MTSTEIDSKVPEIHPSGTVVLNELTKPPFQLMENKDHKHLSLNMSSCYLLPLANAAANTFTNFYLKDLSWSDNDNNMYLEHRLHFLPSQV